MSHVFTELLGTSYWVLGVLYVSLSNIRTNDLRTTEKSGNYVFTTLAGVEKVAFLNITFVNT
jgi:hypothetical protein